MTQAAIVLTGAPATGKSTLAREIARRLGAAIIDQDVATGPMVQVVSRVVGTEDLDDPKLAGLTRDARYQVVTALAVDNLRAGLPVVLVAPFTTERRDLAAWTRLSERLSDAGGQPLLVWIWLPPEEIVGRLRERAAPRDAGKLDHGFEQGPARDQALTRANQPPVGQHLELDGRSDPAELLERVVLALRP